jgi:O-antigen ligase
VITSPSRTFPPSVDVKKLSLFLALLLLFAGGIALATLATRDGTNLWVALPVAIAPPALFLTIRKWPAIFLAPVVYIGNFKDRPAEGFSLSDPTVLCLALLLFVVIIDFVSAYLERPHKALLYLLRGQEKAILVFIAFQSLVAVSVFHTRSPEYGQALVTKFVTIGLLLFIAPLVVLRDERDFKHLAVIVIVLAVPLAMRRILVVAGTSNSLEDITQISAGDLLGIAVLLTVTYQVTASRVLKAGLLLFLLLAAAGLIASDARGPALTCLLLVCLAMFSGNRSIFLASRMARVSMLVLMLATAAFSIARMTSSVSGGRVRQKQAELLRIFSGEAPGGTAGARLWGYEAAISGFIEKPIVGWGAGGSFGYMSTHRGLFGKYGADLELRYPHNIFLQVAMEQGIFGLAALLTFLYLVFKSTRSLSNGTNGRLSCFFWILLFNCITIMFSGDIDNRREVWLWCGVALAMHRAAVSGAIRNFTERPAPARRLL